MQSSLLLVRPAPDKRTLRRSLRGKPPSALIGEEASGTRVYPAWLPADEDMGARLARRAWRRIETLARERGILFALAPGMDRRSIGTLLYGRGITLLDPEGVRQYLTIAALERWFTLLGRDTVSEITASVEDADGKWGSLWIRFLSEWVRYLTVSGRAERMERLRQEILARDGTVLAIDRQSRADIRILLGARVFSGDERILIDVRPAWGEHTPRALCCGWPAVPEPDDRELFTLWERTLMGVYQTLGHRFFSACAAPRSAGTDRGAGALLSRSGIQVKGFLTDTTGITFDSMRYQFLEEWSQTMADRKKRRLDICRDHDL